MHKPSVKLAFITVNYNGLADTRALLASIDAAALTMSFAVVVVDNGSVVDEWQRLRDDFKDFTALVGIHSAANLGFAGGNNLGMTLVVADYYYFINNDTLLPPSANSQIKEMLAFLAKSPSVAGLTPKIMYVEPPNMIQFAGCTPLHSLSIRNRQIGYQEEDKGQYQKPIAIPYMHGAAMLLRGDVLREVGPMPEDYFLYYEEVDWCFIIGQKYKMYYFPDAFIQHKESASTGIDSPFKTYYLTRNRFLFTFRNRKGFTRILAVLYLSVAASIHAGRQWLRGRKDSSKAIISGVNDAFLGIVGQRKA